MLNDAAEQSLIAIKHSHNKVVFNNCVLGDVETV